MKITLTASFLISTFLLTGCSSSKEEKTIKQPEKQRYEISQEFVFNEQTYTDLKKYKASRKLIISEEITNYVLKEGYSEDGYDAQGFDRRGYNRNRVNEKGFDVEGYNLHSINEKGRNREGQNSTFQQPFDEYGYDEKGYDAEGFDRLGYNSKGYNIDGFNKLGESENTDELSMKDFIKRDWKTISADELLQYDLMYPFVKQYMKTYPQLKNQYFEESMHPFSEESYYINLLYNSVPAMFDDLFSAIRLDLMNQLEVEHPINTDKKYVLEAADKSSIELINDEALIPTRYLQQINVLKSLKKGQEIDLENEEGIIQTYQLKEKRQLNELEQNYIDIARVVISNSKGKWAEAKWQLDRLFYEAADQSEHSLKLNEKTFKQLHAIEKKAWPKAYLTDSNEEIEQFNDEQREAFISEIMYKLSGQEIIAGKIKSTP